MGIYEHEPFGAPRESDFEDGTQWRMPLWVHVALGVVVGGLVLEVIHLVFFAGLLASLSHR